MAFDESIGNQVRALLQAEPNVLEKRMFGGLCFMVNDKMCVGVVKDELMCRIHPDLLEEVLEKRGCRQMDFTGKAMKGFVYVDQTGFSNPTELKYWVDLCLAYNPLAKSSKKK